MTELNEVCKVGYGGAPAMSKQRFWVKIRPCKKSAQGGGAKAVFRERINTDI